MQAHSSQFSTRTACISLLGLLLVCSIVRAQSNHLKANLNSSSSSNQNSLKSAKNLVEQAGSINLKAVLEHQAALEEECAKYHRDILNQIQKLIDYDARNDDLQFQYPLSVKVPSVCLFLFTQFRKSEPWNELQHQSKLDFVNWIYNEEIFRRQQQQQQNATTTNEQELEKAFKKESGQLVNDYLLDPHRDFENEIETEDRKKFHQTVDSMMANEQFKETIKRNRNKISHNLSPVILIPGLLGSRLQARSDKKSSVNILCNKKHDWKDIWLSVKNLLPFLVDCWLDNVRLELDGATNFTQNPAGIQSRVANFGKVESVSYLDPSRPQLTKYFSAIIDTYSSLGYTPNENLLAAPYDFRLAPQELSSFYLDLKSLIEDAQEKSESGKKVTLVCHSMGCTHLLVFLRQQTSDWRRSKIRKMIAISSPWGGSAKALKALVVGDRLDLPVVSEAKMRMLARTYPSIAFLLPQADVFGDANMFQGTPGGPVLVETPSRSYQAADIPDLLRDLNLEDQLRWYQQTTALIKPKEPLNDVQVDCIHALNTPTPQTLVFRNQSDFPNDYYDLVKGDGDGTVNFNSLLICENWAKSTPSMVRFKVIQNTNHVGLLSHKSTMTFITDDVLNDDKY